MNSVMPNRGTLRHSGDTIEGRLVRRFGHRREELWNMLTDPVKLAQWLAPGSIEPCVGGEVRIDFHDSGVVIDSVVLEFEPPHVLAYSWGSRDDPHRPLRWELDEDGSGTSLTLTVRLPTGEDAARACAGFEGHLEMLAAALEGVPIKFPVDLFRQAREDYLRLLGS